jgi:hypothetical protein
MPYCDARRLLAAMPIVPTNQTLETAFFLAFPFFGDLLISERIFQ